MPFKPGVRRQALLEHACTAAHAPTRHGAAPSVKPTGHFTLVSVACMLSGSPAVLGYYPLDR
jgi:hypothetical protein